MASFCISALRIKESQKWIKLALKRNANVYLNCAMLICSRRMLRNLRIIGSAIKCRGKKNLGFKILKLFFSFKFLIFLIKYIFLLKNNYFSKTEIFNVFTTISSSFQVQPGTTCKAVCENRPDSDLIAICIGQISSSTCLSDGRWSTMPSCHCSKNSCGEPSFFNLKQRRLGGGLVYSKETSRNGLNSIVTATCPVDSELKCTKGNQAKCILNKFGTLNWDSDSECECIKV